MVRALLASIILSPSDEDSWLSVLILIAIYLYVKKRQARNKGGPPQGQDAPYIIGGQPTGQEKQNYSPYPPTLVSTHLFLPRDRPESDPQRRRPPHHLRVNSTRGKDSGIKVLLRTNTPLRLSQLPTSEFCGNFRGQEFAHRCFVLLLVTRYEPDLHCNTRSKYFE